MLNLSKLVRPSFLSRLADDNRRDLRDGFLLDGLWYDILYSACSALGLVTQTSFTNILMAKS
ncbi:hypothetical protein BpHYR1_047341 [Brachionus plicatilis]|uniref:Uncharacterized protein n=1 Tax=Brachionus plicatilis TaxID=10195 RepID=A0A3M7RTG8_BRAPC|nr:hypothetical protein BpHYR1_047341 [Brachionus plicatilis]